MHVVSTERHAGTVARREHGSFGRRRIGATVTVDVAEPVEARDAGEEHVAAAGKDAGRRSLDESVEAVREDGRRVGHAVAVGIDEQPHAIIVGFPLAGLVAEQPTVIGLPVLDRLRGEIGIDPLARMPPVVAHTAVLPERLADKDPPLLIDGEGDGVRHIGLSGKERYRHASGHAEGRAGLHRLIRADRDYGRLGGRRRSTRGHRQRHGQHASSDEDSSYTDLSKPTEHHGHASPSFLFLESARRGVGVLHSHHSYHSENVGVDCSL